MILTLEKLFNNPQIMAAVIDRTIQTEQDIIFWKKYLDFEETKSRVFKTYIGTSVGVTMASVIDRNSGKPIRERKSLGSGYGEVAFLGNGYQLDNDRLDFISELINKYNAGGTGQGQTLNEIINFLVDDVRQCTLAPHKRMDYVVGQLRSTGKATVKLGDNKEGIELIDIELPVIKHEPTSSDKANFIDYLKEKIEAMRSQVGTFAVMEMTRKTFNNRIVTSKAFQDSYKMILGTSQIALNGGLITDTMANQLLTGIGLPPIRLVEEYVTKEDETAVNTFADERIALLPTQKLGKMKWFLPYESKDPIPTKNYTRLEGGHFIATQRTDEGRFIEFGAEWIPDFKQPNKIAIIDTSKMG
ncbi:hypothetical protein [Capnocytophaga sp.]|uniref:hypothetical protein n=1 Tax=Capnocytophaga sp. TaxID=44737 RepID=UPI0026DCB254|nr:hypothetical protein [Capnocytophaga sp.]MDO5106031.1 hypothetical protein [Capnocytophaga sp.]